MNAPTDWLSAAAILAAGLVLGLMFIYVLRRRRNTPSDLASKRDALLARLRELGESDAEERARLELETADVLRAIDESEVVVVQPRKPRPVLKGFAWGVACTVAVGFVVHFAMVKSEQKPNVDVEERIALAKDALAKNDLMGTFEQTKAVLASNPDEPRALTYNAIVRMAMGQVDEAKTMLESATNRDPMLLDAWVALASLHTQAGDDKAASAAIDNAVAQHPAEEPRLRQVLAQMRSQKALPPAAPSDLPPDHPPLRIAEAETATAAKPIRITLSLGSSAKAKNGVVYVIARAEGESGGHPVAVKRIDAASFPLSLDLGGADSMMGQPLPGTVRIEARLDSDGDAGTVDAGDPKAFVDGVIPGAALMLKLE